MPAWGVAAGRGRAWSMKPARARLLEEKLTKFHRRGTHITTTRTCIFFRGRLRICRQLPGQQHLRPEDRRHTGYRHR